MKGAKQAPSRHPPPCGSRSMAPLIHRYSPGLNLHFHARSSPSVTALAGVHLGSSLPSTPHTYHHMVPWTPWYFFSFSISPISAIQATGVHSGCLSLLPLASTFHPRSQPPLWWGTAWAWFLAVLLPSADHSLPVERTHFLPTHWAGWTSGPSFRL